MRSSWFVLGCVCAAAIGVAAPVGAVAQQVSDVRVDVFLKDADMVAATRMLTQRAGLQFVIEPSSEPFDKITLKLDSVTPEDAIRYICQAAGAYFRRDENGVYIISRRPFEAVVAPEEVAPAKAPRRLKRVHLQRADARDVFDQIVYGAAANTSRGFEEIKRFANLTQQDTARIFGTPTVGNGQVPQSPVFSPQAAVPNRLPMAESGHDVRLPGEGASQLMGGGQMGGGQMGGGLGGGLGGGGQAGGGLGGGQAAAAQLVGGQGLVPDGIDFISYDPTTNTLMVRGDDQAIEDLRTIIELFDQAPRQVIIKVEFITTTDTLERALGYDFLYQRGAVVAGNRPGAFARTGDPIFINYATGNITARLRASLTDAQARVVNAPILRTLNNQPALLFSSITTTIFIPTVTQGALGGVVTTFTPVPIPVTTSLGITPRINFGDGTITVFLQPQIANIVGVSIGPDGQQIPNVSTQFVAVVARVRSGETILLGGLTNKTADTATIRYPILGDLPIIGQFFRATRRSRANTELLIFVTPTIVEEDYEGGAIP
jgi:general secretion pathway protein D